MTSFLFCASPAALAQIPMPKSYVCYTTKDSIVVDGNLTESSWEKAPWTDWFVDIQGNQMPSPRYRTRAKMLWDTNYFYIGAEIQEPDVWATITERDAVIFHDDDYEVFIDPDGDTHQYYEFEMNALNTIWDLLLIKPYRDGGPPVNAWDIHGLKSAVQIDGTINHPGDKDKGWFVEIAFPWKVLKECAHKNAPPMEGDQWRVNFSRVEWRVKVDQGKYVKVSDVRTGRELPEDNWVWSPQGLIDMHYPEMWGFVQFSDEPVGTGQESFTVHPEENAKWALRKIYYRQKEFYRKSGHYSSSASELGLGNVKVGGYIWPPTIQCTSSLFEAVIKSVDGKERWHISDDGRTWKE